MCQLAPGDAGKPNIERERARNFLDDYFEDTFISPVAAEEMVKMQEQSNDAPALELIEIFGVMLADAEIECGTKHRAAFTALSKMREQLLGRARSL